MPVGGASSWASVFTLCNSAIGAGVLSLPFAFQSAGVLGGLLLCLIIGGMEGFTLYVLSKAAQRYEASSYNKLVRKCLGKKLGLVLASIQVVYLAGSCVAYQPRERNHIMSLLRDTCRQPPCPPSVPYLSPAWGSSPCAVKITALSSLSSIAVAGFVYTALAVVYSGLQLAAARPPGRHWEGMQLVKWDLQALYAIPIVVFGFNCHANVVTIFSELMPRPDRLLHILPASPSDYASLPFYTPRPSSLKMIGMLGVIASALGIIMSGYLLVGSAGYIAYPLNANSNILNSFPADDHVIQVRAPFRRSLAAGVTGPVRSNHCNPDGSRSAGMRPACPHHHPECVECTACLPGAWATLDEDAAAADALHPFLCSHSLCESVSRQTAASSSCRSNR
ncbi:MAG: hypothetical protein WDW38_006147 [Sanguina aurantia]